MTNENLKFDRMSEVYLPDILFIEQASFSDPWSLGMFEQELEEDPGKISMVLTLNDKLIGYGIGWIVLDEFHLGNLAVSPGHKGKGYGRLILSRLLETVREKGCRLATLEVRVSNIVAINLYHKFNFKEMAVRKKYYQDEDALVLLARLDEVPGC